MRPRPEHSLTQNIAGANILEEFRIEGSYMFAKSFWMQVVVSHSSGLPCCWGTTPEGRFLFCVYEKIDGITVYPVTAYEPSEE